MTAHRYSQRGVMLLEALIGILIFSIGILAVIGMQAISIQNIGEAKDRTDASFLANEIIGKMWADRGGATANLMNFQYHGGGATGDLGAWVGKVKASLPGSIEPDVSITPIIVNTGTGNYTAYNVQVTLKWQSPTDASTSQAPHVYTTTAFMQWCAPNATGAYMC